MSGADAQRYEAHVFLKALFGNKPPGMVVMVMREGHWDKAEAYLSWQPIVERFGQPDVYVGCCALARKPGRGSRGKASEAGFFPGAWADVDIDGSPIRGSDRLVTGHAPSLEAATRAIVKLAPPSLLIYSGFGLQPWWLIDRGLVLRDAGMQRRAERCVQGLQRRLAADAGWKVDSTGDLSRVLRLAGTTNTKRASAVPVRLASSSGPRYTLEQLEQLAGEHLERGGTGTLRAARPACEWAELVRDGVDIGERHERIWQLAGYLLRREIDPQVALELLQAFNVARVRPPYDEAKVKHLFDGIVRLEVARRRSVGVSHAALRGGGPA